MFIPSKGTTQTTTSMTARGAVAFCLAICLALSVAGCGPIKGSVSKSKPPSTNIPSAKFGTVGPLCISKDLRVSNGPYVPTPTATSPVSITLGNVTKELCRVIGYPTISLSTSGGTVLPFEYIHGGSKGFQAVTAQPPRSVDIPPGQSVYVTLVAEQCVLVPGVTPSLMEVSVPHEFTLTISQPFNLGRQSLAYCGASNPSGSIVYVSPFEPTLKDTLGNG